MDYSEFVDALRDTKILTISWQPGVVACIRNPYVKDNKSFLFLGGGEFAITLREIRSIKQEIDHYIVFLSGDNRIKICVE